MADEEACYKIKHILWPPGSGESRRKVPIVCQDENGPCPLIAILNVLLLRGTITLPTGVGEVTQARAMQLLAEHLLDTNFSRAQLSTVSAEYRANLQHNLSDSIALLPKLTTGVDVNVRFDGPRSFEYTGETAVFDLLGIDLVHGWLVDPEDAPTAAAIGSRSYNEVIIAIVNQLGRDATPQALSRRTSTVKSPHAATPQHAHNKIDAAALSDALKNTLTIAIPTEGSSGAPAGVGELRLESTQDSGVSQAWSPDSMASLNRMLGETVHAAFKTPTAGKSMDIGSQLPRNGDEGQQQPEHIQSVERIPPLLSPSGSSDLEGPQAPPPSTSSTFRREPLKSAVDTPAEANAGVPHAHDVEVASPALAAERVPDDGRSPGPNSPAAPPPTAHSQLKEQELALVMQEFLDNNPSQLTVFGLASLIDTLKEGALAVFFRNNHFNVLLRHGSNLYILITDQGYLWEPDVVWEHLSDVDGDTQLVGWDLKGFAPHDEDRRSFSDPIHGGGGPERREGDADSGARSGKATEDADFALALQLQQEEEERMRVAEERQSATAADGATPVQRHRTGSGTAALGSSARPPDGRRPGKSKKSTDCSIM